MKAFLVKPESGLYFREARPFESPLAQKSMFMPYPSTLYGALRTVIGDRFNVDWGEFKKGNCPDDLKAVIGTPEKTGSLRLHYFCPFHIPSGQVLLPAPADMVGEMAESDAKKKELDDSVRGGIQKLEKRNKNYEICRSNYGLQSPFLHYSSFYGSFITYEVYQDYLRNGKPDWVLQRGKDFFYISDMADWDGRTGNKIDSVSGCVEEGQLYHLNLLHLKKDFCFFAQIDGDNDFLDKNVFITLGGERRRCFIEKTEPIFFGSLRTGNKLVFISPAAFADSEKPFGVPADMALIPGYVSRAGYNIAMNHPKPLQRLVPAGAVYWFSEGFSLSEKIVNDICDFEQGFGSFLLAGGRK